jgi:hypothetical protein
MDVTENIDAEQRRSNAGDYHKIAKQLEDEYKIPIHVGRTGLLSLQDMNQDRTLRGLAIGTRGRSPLPIAQMLFAIDPINMIDLSLMTLTPPRLYESVGPLKDRWMQARPRSVSNRRMALVRVVQAQAAQAPDTVTATYDRTGVRLLTYEPNAPRDLFAVRDQVAADLKTLAGFQRAQAQAATFMQQIESQGWEAALAELNRTVGEQLKERPQDPNVFVMQTRQGLRRTSISQLFMLEQEGQHNPVALTQYSRNQASTQLSQQLYDLLGSDADRLETPQLVISAQDSSVYCIKDLRIKRLTQEEYEKNRIVFFLQENFIQSQSLAVDHFRPDHVIARSRFAWDKPDKNNDRAGDTNDAQP